VGKVITLFRGVGTGHLLSLRELRLSTGLAPRPFAAALGAEAGEPMPGRGLASEDWVVRRKPSVRFAHGPLVIPREPHPRRCGFARPQHCPVGTSDQSPVTGFRTRLA
jgi:hypothetical protein